MGGNDCFFRPQHCYGGGGGGGGKGGRKEGRQVESKSDQKIVISCRVLRNNYLEGFFHTVPSCFVVHCGLLSAVCRLYSFNIHLNLFVQRMDSVSQRINHYPPDKYWWNQLRVVNWIAIYPLDSAIHLWNNWAPVPVSIHSVDNAIDFSNH